MRRVIHQRDRSDARTEREPAAAPPLVVDPAFWGITVTQFLGAFNDNFFKQLILLLALSVADRDLQPLAMAVFAAPFLMFSGFAGYLSDRHSKRTVIVASKLAEVVVMSLGLVAFLSFSHTGLAGLLVVLFLMGTQSAFFGPGKYGILPEMLRPHDLARANGMILMTTFIGIIGGTVAAGFAMDASIPRDLPDGSGVHHPAPAALELSSAASGGVAHRAAGTTVSAAAAPPRHPPISRLWMAALFSVSIAVVGTVTSLLIRKVVPSKPGLRFEASSMAVSSETRRRLLSDRPLLVALLASCMFWLLAGITQPAVNSLGDDQLELNATRTSLLTGSIAVGIVIGAPIGGLLSRGTADFRVMRFGAWTMVVSLGLLALPGGSHEHLWGYPGSFLPLVTLGIAAGMFAIPLQVFLQARPPDGLKGRMIAVMNQFNFLAILLSAGVYLLFDSIVVAFGWSRSTMFAFAALLMLPVAVFYRSPGAGPAALSDGGES